MSLNQNQNISLFCSQCNEDRNISISLLQKSSMVYCASGQHNISEQADKVIKGLKKSVIFLDNDLKKIQGVL